MRAKSEVLFMDDWIIGFLNCLSSWKKYLVMSEKGLENVDKNNASPEKHFSKPVSYTHLTLPTNREE